MPYYRRKYKRYYKRKYKRRYGGRRRGFRRFRRSSYRSRAIKNTKIHVVRHLLDIEAEFSPSIAAPVAFLGYAFKLNDVSNYTHLTQLYDEYKINCAVITIVPAGDMVSTQDFRNYIPYVGYTQDDDDAIVPSSLDVLRDRSGYREKRLDKPVSFKITRPKYSIAAWNGVVSANVYAKPETGYLDCAYPGILHYGGKFALFNFNAAAQQTYRFIIKQKLYMSFRKMH